MQFYKTTIDPMQFYEIRMDETQTNQFELSFSFSLTENYINKQMDAIMMQITPGAKTLLNQELNYIGFDLYDMC